MFVVVHMWKFTCGGQRAAPKESVLSLLPQWSPEGGIQVIGVGNKLLAVVPPHQPGIDALRDLTIRNLAT